MDGQGLLKRVHSRGSSSRTADYRFSIEKMSTMNVKKALARKALPFIKEDSVIIIDGSTTNLALVKEIPVDFRATIITNSPAISVELAQRANIEVIKHWRNLL